jgi:nicotinate-nucleotide adenylyltransferase
LRLGIFGGTFDPFHCAHLAVARTAADTIQLDRVLIVPAARPPHKGGLTHASFDDRVRMAELACAVDSRLEVSRIEEGMERSYSIDTIEQVSSRLDAGDELFFIIGADAFAEVTTWRRWRDLIRAVRFIVVSRPGHGYDVPEGAKVERLDLLDLPVSSSDIRRRLALGEAPSEVPAAVLEYVARRGLYLSAS